MMSSEFLPRESTNYLKGIMIVPVLICHYGILYFDFFHGYVNSGLALFFLLSGAGIFLSLEGS